MDPITEAEAAEMVCDLCNIRGGITWTYLTYNVATDPDDAERKGVPYIEDNEWAVCTPCHEVIETGEFAELVLRHLACNKMLLIGDGADEIFKASVERLILVHQYFWNHRKDHWPEPGHNIVPT